MKKNLIGTLAQLALLLIICPLAFLLLEKFLPQQTWASFMALLGEIPLVGDVLNIVNTYVEMKADETAYLNFFVNYIDLISASMKDAVLMGMCILGLKELFILIGLRGVPILGALTGTVLGAIVVEAFKTADMTYKILSVIFLVLLNLLIILLTEPGRHRVKKWIGIIGMGGQALIAGFSLFYFACLFRLFAGETYLNFAQVFRLGILPSAILLGFIALDYYCATAT